MASYQFLTAWLLDAPREDVWDAIWDSGDGRPGGAASSRRSRPTRHALRRRPARPYAWRSRIPYPVRFEVVSTLGRPPALLEGEASGGLEGIGRWRFFEHDGVTAALYEWNVRTTKPWMNAVAPIAATRSSAGTTTRSCAGAARAGPAPRLPAAGRKLSPQGVPLGEVPQRQQLLADHHQVAEHQQWREHAEDAGLGSRREPGPGAAILPPLWGAPRIGDGGLRVPT